MTVSLISLLLKVVFLVQKILLFNLFLFLFIFNSCNIGSPSPGFQQQVSSRELSLNDPNLRTCVFDPGRLVVHFPMYHAPSEVRNVSVEGFERVVRSQFQLLHTLLDYNRSYIRLAVFEESVITDLFNEDYINQIKQNSASADTFTRLDGTRFFIANERRRAVNLFQGGFPAFYEQMNPEQKKILWDLGASKTLYLLEEIPRLYSVIAFNEFELVKSQLGGDFSGANIQQNSYWVFTYREQRLRDRILFFRSQNPSWNGLVFIAYGRNHDFSDDFAGYPFQSGHSFCLAWDRTNRVANTPAIAPAQSL